MENMHYALSSVFYHKKISFGIGACSAFFLLVATGLLNLIDIEKASHIQLTALVNGQRYDKNYQTAIHLMKLLYFTSLIFFVLLFISLIFFSIFSKKVDILKWQLRGFSTNFIVVQFILASIIPIFIGFLFVIIFLMIFQSAYEFILVQFRSFITDEATTTFTTVVATHSAIQFSAENTHFLSLEITQVKPLEVLHAFFKNCLVVSLVSVLATVLATWFCIKNTRKFEDVEK